MDGSIYLFIYLSVDMPKRHNLLVGSDIFYTLEHSPEQKNKEVNFGVQLLTFATKFFFFRRLTVSTSN